GIALAPNGGRRPRRDSARMPRARRQQSAKPRASMFGTIPLARSFGPRRVRAWAGLSGGIDKPSVSEPIEKWLNFDPPLAALRALDLVRAGQGEPFSVLRRIPQENPRFSRSSDRTAANRTQLEIFCPRASRGQD